MKKLYTILLLLVAFTTVNAQDCLLEKAPVQNLVQDYADVMTDAEEQGLRQALLTFEDSTSTQILIVTVTDLCDYDKAEFTYTLGEKWGVGQDGKNNGIVIMVKPKEIDGRGEVFIAPGYGIEGVLPDAIAKRIVEREMIPYFKQKDYYGGIAAAAVTTMEITGGEYSADEYNSNGGIKTVLPFLGVLFIFMIIMITRARQTSKYAATNNMGFWAAWTLMNASSRNHGGSYGGFSSGGGSFGGFGGGSFGGGGAGGSW
ncbi:MAG: TPM domain-containing protein [Vicingaceae bacterium]|nr:TPM domain-containing protein [Vicingaceae bacterium]